MTEWFISANTQFYNLENAFKDLGSWTLVEIYGFIKRKEVIYGKACERSNS